MLGLELIHVGKRGPKYPINMLQRANRQVTGKQGAVNTARRCVQGQRELVLEIWYTPGGRLNKKDRLTGYGDPHVKDKTSYRPSYL